MEVDMARCIPFGAVLVLLLVSSAAAEETEERPPLAYDEVNPPFEKVLEQAQEQSEPIFLEFSAEW